MPQKILVTTDLSASSKAGIRFAIQLATQNGSAIVCLHVITLPKPTRWSEKQYGRYVDAETAKVQEALLKFVQPELRTAPGIKIKCVVQHGVSVDQTVIRFAGEIRANYICLSTRGGGIVRKILGSNASVMLTTSPIPVLVVPQTYRKAPITQLFYASDFNNLGYELKKVKDFAAPLKAKINVFHYDYLLHVRDTVAKLKQAAARFRSPGVSFTFEKQNIEESLAYHLRRDVRKTKASVAVLFTKQNRGWFERIFFASKSADLSFATTIPLLIFRKRAS